MSNVVCHNLCSIPCMYKFINTETESYRIASHSSENYEKISTFPPSRHKHSEDTHINITFEYILWGYFPV